MALSVKTQQKKSTLNPPMPTARDLFGPLADTRHLPKRERAQVARLEMQVLTGGPVLPLGHCQVSLWAQAVEQAAQTRAASYDCGSRPPEVELEAVTCSGAFDPPEPGEIFALDRELYVCRGVIVEAMGDEEHLVLAQHLPEDPE